MPDSRILVQVLRLRALIALAVVTLVCAFFFPNRREELNPELWAKSEARPLAVPAE